ncbi:hypothetical protein BO70DRAFT_396739 [Aspergillus heteromorphus CBS 117.55]|uniref:Uncharacterized protein n=1 Tax=Aspergillus heteromorphus CBS 117.55 TaxID=1448321 RepID=A0A317W5T8_9EURO|nr:uncharacterized protein BO70DRAFT_396739 [Aspergillus heteromorphus CBS 117.55]PWY81954.1 hypothetical protein BO70DRAFT_396739 [Aspergillus heteromorphus CBS 117.55]
MTPYKLLVPFNKDEDYTQFDDFNGIPLSESSLLANPKEKDYVDQDSHLLHSLAMAYKKEVLSERFAYVASYKINGEWFIVLEDLV